MRNQEPSRINRPKSVEAENMSVRLYERAIMKLEKQSENMDPTSSEDISTNMMVIAENLREIADDIEAASVLQKVYEMMGRCPKCGCNLLDPDEL